jgi:hypothetical protein
MWMPARRVGRSGEGAALSACRDGEQVSITAAFIAGRFSQ